MGSGRSGLYSGTRGSYALILGQVNYKARTTSSSTDTIASRTVGLDLQEHPRGNSLTTKQKKNIKKKIISRKVTKKEYKQYESDRRFANRRKAGVRRFWSQEKARLMAGLKPTRDWSESQRNEILHNKRPTYKGKPLQGHHAYSASKFPHLANRGEVIFPVTIDEHLQGWHGGNYQNSLPGKPIRYETKHDFRREK